MSEDEVAALVDKCSNNLWSLRESSLLDLAAHVIQAVDEQRGATNLESLQSEVSHVLFPCLPFQRFGFVP